MAWYNPLTWFDTGAEEKYGDLKKQVPQTPTYSPYFEQMRSQMAGAGRPGEGFQNTEYYKALMGDVQNQAAQLGRATGQRLTEQGVAGASTSGPAMRAAYDNTEVIGRMRQQAMAQAQAQKAQQDAQYFSQMLQNAGFEKGIGDTRFEQEYRRFLAMKGLTDAQIEAAVQEMQTWLGVIGGGANLGATLLTGGAGGGAAAGAK